MADFGSRNMGFFGGTSSGGGTSTGVNGLNGTTNIGLGGTLTNANTVINGNFTNTLYFGQQGFLIFETYGSAQLFGLGASFSGFLNISTNQDSVQFNSYLTSDGTKNTIYLQNYFQIRTKFNNANCGLNLNFSNRQYTLGEYDNTNNKFKLIVDDTNSLIQTTDFNGVNGLVVGTGFTNIGQFTGSFTYIGINQSSATIQTFDTASSSNGLSIDFTSNSYRIGDFRNSSDCILINSANNSIETITSSLIFTGASLQTSNVPTGGTSYLVITLNGVTYNILCQQP